MRLALVLALCGCGVTTDWAVRVPTASQDCVRGCRGFVDDGQWQTCVSVCGGSVTENQACRDPDCAQLQSRELRYGWLLMFVAGCAAAAPLVVDGIYRSSHP